VFSSFFKSKNRLDPSVQVAGTTENHQLTKTPQTRTVCLDDGSLVKGRRPHLTHSWAATTDTDRREEYTPKHTYSIGWKDSYYPVLLCGKGKK